jgi:predicted aldo/keto reductase-like oxidoreductase
VDEEDDYKQVVGPGGVLELALRLKRAGKARFIGLSGHTSQIALRAIQDGHLDVLMHPVNIAWDAEPTRGDLFRLCASRSIGLVAMKTFGGGELFQRESPLSPVKCLSYTLSQPGVSTALVGVRNLEELETDLLFLEATDEAKDFTTIIEDFQQGLAGTCVYCNHCLPCPVEIDIAATIRMLTIGQYGLYDHLRADYGALPVKASDCIECGDCMERCPFGVDVISKMEQTVELFEV